MISLGLRFRGVASSKLATEVLPTTGTVIDGNDVLLAAQPYTQQMISNFLAFGTTTSTAKASATTSGYSGNSSGSASAVTISSETVTTTPQSQVVFDNPKDLPEPWNPRPC
jgi:hypothetical protein